MKLDIYTRVSRLSDSRMLSVEGQEADCRERVTEAGAEVSQVHSDPGRSAWNPRVKRPGWDRLMARIEARETDGVVVFDLTRFTRRPMEGERLIAAAERGLVVLDSEREFDLTSPDGKAAFRDHMKMAAYQSDRTSTTTARGKRRKAMGGSPNVTHRPFGFEPDGVTVRKPEARILREVARRFLAGESQDAIIADLNKRGILTSFGRKWTRTGLRKVLLRPRNAGWVVYRGEPVARMPGTPILDQTTHDRVLALFASRRGRPASPRYMCSGLAVCGLCGHWLTGQPRRNMRPYPDGTARRRYWCAPGGGGCGRIGIDTRQLDDWASDWAIRTMADPTHADTVAEAERAASEARHALEAEAAGIRASLDALLGKLAPPVLMPVARYNELASRLEQRLTEIDAELAGLAPEPESPASARIAALITDQDQRHLHWLAEWRDNPREVIRRALNGRKLVIGPGRSAKFDPDRISIR